LVQADALETPRAFLELRVVRQQRFAVPPQLGRIRKVVEFALYRSDALFQTCEQPLAVPLLRLRARLLALRAKHRVQRVVHREGIVRYKLGQTRRVVGEFRRRRGDVVRADTGPAPFGDRTVDDPFDHPVRVE